MTITVSEAKAMLADLGDMKPSGDGRLYKSEAALKCLQKAAPDMARTIIAMGAEQADDRKRIGCAIIDFLKQAVTDAKELGSGMPFNQGVVRGLEIAIAQIEHGHATASLSKPLSDGE